MATQLPKAPETPAKAIETRPPRSTGLVIWEAIEEACAAPFDAHSFTIGRQTQGRRTAPSRGTNPIGTMVVPGPPVAHQGALLRLADLGGSARCDGSSGQSNRNRTCTCRQTAKATNTTSVLEALPPLPREMQTWKEITRQDG
jgi:hypothetical protein